jgi:hypothetical protein
VRYSYGTDKGRPREAWQRRVEALPPAVMADRLEAYGFSGVVVDRRAYPDAGRALVQGLTDSGRPLVADEAGGGRAFLRLYPRAPARRPESAPRPEEGWYGRPQEQGLWARESRAVWVVENPGATPMAVALRFDLLAARPRRVAFKQEGRELAAWDVDLEVEVRGLRVVLPPGASRLVLESDRAPDVVEIGNRLRPATFAVKGLEMTEAPE